MTIYDIDAAIENFEFDVDENGEITNFSVLEELQMERDRKIENVACYIKNLAAFQAELESEKANIERKIRIAKNRAESMKKFLSMALNGEKFETAKCKVGYRKSERVEIADEVALENYANAHDKSLLRVVTKVEPDKAAIKQLLKSGVKVDGAKIVENRSIQVS